MWINATVEHVRVGVNMGDHAQDVTNAITIGDDTTVSELVEKLLLGQVTRWSEGQAVLHSVPKVDDYIVIRVARPLTE